VNAVLSQIGASELPQIEIYNKIDLIEGMGPRVERDEGGRVRRVWLSAATGQGVDLLLEAMAEFFHHEHVYKQVQLSPADGRLRARLFQLGRIISEKLTEEGGWELEVELPRKAFDRLIHQEPSLEGRLVA